MGPGCPAAGAGGQTDRPGLSCQVLGTKSKQVEGPEYHHPLGETPPCLRSSLHLPFAFRLDLTLLRDLLPWTRVHMTPGGISPHLLTKSQDSD